VSVQNSRLFSSIRYPGTADTGRLSGEWVLHGSDMANRSKGSMIQRPKPTVTWDEVRISNDAKYLGSSKLRVPTVGTMAVSAPRAFAGILRAVFRQHLNPPRFVNFLPVTVNKLKGDRRTTG
jgi:hypothetical protein